jgi:ABC-type branched-subunit amino acid transport system substrate-binding protein
LGIDYQKNFQGASVGVSGHTTPGESSTPNAQVQAVIDYMNAHGGLLGHKIKPVYASESSTAADTASQDQAACTALTQDAHPVAVIISATHTNSLWTCFEQAGIPFIDTVSDSVDNTVLANYPDLVLIDGISLSRLATSLVDGLYQQGYFSPGAKIGLVTVNNPTYANAINQALTPALHTHGLQLTGTVDINAATSASGAGAEAAGAANGVLRFRSEGIDHVIFLADAATVFFWVTSANSQKYTPRYGMASEDNPNQVTSGADPKAQFTNALDLGYLPSEDIPNPPLNAAAQQCKTVESAEGQQGGYGAWSTCDALFTLGQAIDAAGSFAATSILSGFAKINNPQSAALLGSPSFANGRRDSVAMAAMAAFDTSCGCFKYVKSASPLP